MHVSNKANAELHCPGLRALKLCATPWYDVHRLNIQVMCCYIEDTFDTSSIER